MLSLKTILARLVRAPDAFASALAASTVPEWRMEEVDREIARCHRIICAEKSSHQ
jgi:hypothetical protein